MTPTDLQKLHRMCHRAWADAAGRIGLSFSEFEYLCVIKDEEERMRIEDSHGQHLQDIVAALGVAKPSASAMIVKLEGRGLVKRFQCKMDARAQHIILTDAGTEMLTAGHTLYSMIAAALTSEKEDSL